MKYLTSISKKALIIRTNSRCDALVSDDRHMVSEVSDFPRSCSANRYELMRSHLYEDTSSLVHPKIEVR